MDVWWSENNLLYFVLVFVIFYVVGISCGGCKYINGQGSGCSFVSVRAYIIGLYWVPIGEGVVSLCGRGFGRVY